jgi:hypothetical protein
MGVRSFYDQIKLLRSLYIGIIHMNLNLVVAQDAPTIADHENLLIGESDKLPASLCKSLTLNNTLNYLTDEQFKHLLSKVRHGGVVSISAPDVMEISTALCWGQIDVDTFSSLTTNRASQHTLLEVKNIFEQHGYAIESASIQNLSFYIKARRP